LVLHKALLETSMLATRACCLSQYRTTATDISLWSAAGGWNIV